VKAVYTPKYISLNEALIIITDLMAAANPSFTRDGVVDAACRQLVQGLYEGAVRAEGIEWSYMNEDRHPEDEPPILPKAFIPIDQRYWSHGTRFEIGDENLSLDISSVYFSDGNLIYEDYWGYPYAYKNVRVFREDVISNFLNVKNSSEALFTDPQPNKPIYKAGMAGRPTSRHLILSDLRRRAAEGTLAPRLGPVRA